MIDAPEIIETHEQLTAVIHLTVPRAEIQKVMGPGLREVLETLRAQGVEPAGRWFTRHLKMPSDVFDFEVGVPVRAKVTPAGRVENGTLPATKVARTTYYGGYEGLGSAWGELESWINASGHVSASWLWETYVTDPAANPDTSTWRTELTRPLVEA
jgi:effector-binding domain-containing protein